jgi:myosin heavy subunit
MSIKGAIMKQLTRGSKGDKKSKQDLQQELTETQEVIQKQRTQLEDCAHELQRVKDQLSDVEELKAKLSATEKRLVRIKELEKSNDQLKARLRESEHDSSKQVEKIKQGLEASERERSGLMEKIGQLEKEIDSLKGHSDVGEPHKEDITEPIPTSKSSFRVDIYPYQGHYQGKIEHLLSKDKKAFKGLDQNAIKEFIARHLPTPDENHKELKPGGAFRIAPGNSAEQGAQAKVPNLSELKIVRPDSALSCRTIYHDQSFQIQAHFDLGEFNLDAKGPFEHQIIVYANSLEGKPRYTVAQTKGTIRSRDETTVRMTGAAPPEGTYRLGAFVTLSSSRARHQLKPARSFYSGELFHVL